VWQKSFDGSRPKFSSLLIGGKFSPSGTAGPPPDINFRKFLTVFVPVKDRYICPLGTRALSDEDFGSRESGN